VKDRKRNFEIIVHNKNRPIMKKVVQIFILLIEKDKNGSFQKKLESFYSKMPEQKYDFDDVFNDLYPELR